MSLGLILIVTIFLLFAVTGALVLIGLRRLAGGEEALQERIQVYAAIPELNPHYTGRGSTRFTMLRLRVNSMLSALSSEKLTWQLLSANWPMSSVEFILIRFGGALFGLLFGWLAFRHPLSGIGLGILAYMVPGLILTRAINGRRLKFERQLVDVLVLLNGAVRAGFSLLQAMEVIVREMSAPASEEFERVTREVALGLSQGQALGNLAARMHNRDLDLMVTAINIHYQVGGNLATMLAAVTETIRDRIRLFAEVRVITTQQRYTAYILTVLPFLVAAAMFFINPIYMAGLFNPELICVPMTAVIMVAIGFITIQRMIRIDF